MCEWEGKDGLLLERHFHLGAFTILELKTALKKMKFFLGGGGGGGRCIVTFICDVSMNSMATKVNICIEDLVPFLVVKA
jgi:hypothetical protein